MLPLGYSITGSGKGVDVKAFKIAAFRDSMRRQYTSRTLQVEWPLGVTGCKTPSEYMSSELLQIADIVRSAFHHSANLLVLQITAFWVRAIPR